MEKTEKTKKKKKKKKTIKLQRSRSLPEEGEDEEEEAILAGTQNLKARPLPTHFPRLPLLPLASLILAPAPPSVTAASAGDVAGTERTGPRGAPGWPPGLLLRTMPAPGVQGLPALAAGRTTLYVVWPSRTTSSLPLPHWPPPPLQQLPAHRSHR